MSVHGLKVRWVQESDYARFGLRQLKPVDQTRNTTQIVDQMHNLLKSDDYSQYLEKNSNKMVQQVFKTIVIEYNGQCIALGSILVRKFSQKKVSANLGHFLIDPHYPAKSQLIHTLIFSLENIAWINGADYVVISSGDVLNAGEIVKELEYQSYQSPNKKFFFLKYK